MKNGQPYVSLEPENEASGTGEGMSQLSLPEEAELYGASIHAVKSLYEAAASVTSLVRLLDQQTQGRHLKRKSELRQSLERFSQLLPTSDTLVPSGGGTQRKNGCSG